MGIDLADYLVIGISSRALFDLSPENEIFESEGLEAYSAYQIEHEDEPLQPGTGFPLVKAILHLNRLVPGKRRSEVVVMSRNNADTSLRIFRSIEHTGWISLGRRSLQVLRYHDTWRRMTSTCSCLRSRTTFSGPSMRASPQRACTPHRSTAVCRRTRFESPST